MQGDGSVTGTPRKTAFQRAQEELEMQRTGLTGDFMPSNPPGMRQTRPGGSAAQPEAPGSSQRRSRYSSGKPGGYGSPDYVPAPSTGSSSRRGSGAKNRDYQPIDMGQGADLGRQIGRGTKTSQPKNGTTANKGWGDIGDIDTTPREAPAESRDEKPIAPTEINTDESTLINSNGVVQKGRNLGYRSTITKGEGNTPYLEGEGGLFDRLGLGTGTQINRGWASNQLPGTETAIYSGKPQSQQLGEGEQQVVLSKDLDQDGGAVRNLESMPQEAFAESQKGGNSSGGQRNWMEKGPEDAKMARRRAFLDAPNSMAGMRAVDAQLGRVRSGNDFFYANPNQGKDGADEFIKVSLADGRKHQNDQITGQQLLNQYVDKIKGENVGNPDAPSPAEFSPDMSEEQFVDFQNRGGSQRSLEDTEIEDFINYQN